MYIALAIEGRDLICFLRLDFLLGQPRLRWVGSMDFFTEKCTGELSGRVWKRRLLFPFCS